MKQLVQLAWCSVFFWNNSWKCTQDEKIKLHKTNTYVPTYGPYEGTVLNNNYIKSNQAISKNGASNIIVGCHTICAWFVSAFHWRNSHGSRRQPSYSSHSKSKKWRHNLLNSLSKSTWGYVIQWILPATVITGNLSKMNITTYKEYSTSQHD